MRRAVLLGAVLLAACQSATAAPADPRNATFTLDQRRVTLSNGTFEEAPAPGSAAKATTRLSDKGAVGDVNGDAKPDVVAVLTFSGGGSGTFYYLAVLLGDGTAQGDPTNAILLGDRIAVDAVRVDGPKISVDVLDRRAGEPFSTAPSVKATRVFQVNARTLAEIK